MLYKPVVCGRVFVSGVFLSACLSIFLALHVSVFFIYNNVSDLDTTLCLFRNIIITFYIFLLPLYLLLYMSMHIFVLHCVAYMKFYTIVGVVD